MNEDLTVFFEGLDCVEVTFPNFTTKYAYFDKAFLDAQIGEVVLDGTQPRLTCIYEEVKDLERGDLAIVREIEYSVLEVQPEGTGFATVTLAP